MLTLLPFAKRFDFGRRLEPPGSQVLHGAGQSPDAFLEYFGAVGANKPKLYMTYTELRANLPMYFERLTSELAACESYHLIPQLGLLMTGVADDPHNQQEHQPERHYEEAVAAGKLDSYIEQLCDGLKGLNRSVYLRIGFEFNGPWFGYQPDEYRAAWIRIVQALRQAGLENVAAVWCYCPLPAVGEQPWGKDRDYEPYYPGDESVDWWAIDLFSADDFSIRNTQWFMEDARKRGFPVMIGESTPRWAGGVQGGAATWERWFVPYFNFIRSHPTVKAFCYINWDWTQYPVWSDWGDARIQMNEIILKSYRQELAHEWYAHAER